MALGKRNKKAKAEKTPKKALVTEVVDMDRKLEETPAASGLTPLQMYMREKIQNATKKD